MMVNDVKLGIRWTDLLSLDQFFSDRCVDANTATELSLQWAVFSDGLQQYYTLAEDEDGRNSEEFREEESWLLVDDEGWLFSFKNLCETFGFQPGSVRTALTTWKNIQIAAATSNRKKKALRGLPQI